MKRLILGIAAVLLAVVAVAEDTTISATAVKKLTTQAIKTGEYAEVVSLLEKAKAADARTQAVVLNAVKAALNTSTLKTKVPALVDALNASGAVLITKQAGGKYGVQFHSDGKPTKEDIPRAAVEKPTLSTNPAANAR